jgi:DNA-binding response OmpR family regulator
MLLGMSACILIVDDEPAVTDLLAYNLRQAHYEVLVAADGQRALHLALQAKPDLILLDLMLPVIDGLDVCRELRKSSQVPIIMITARGEETDRVVGLELGADDYLCKPFSVRELMARIKAVLRRTQTGPEIVPEAAILRGPGSLLLDPESRAASLEGTPVALTRLEFDLLYTLRLNPGRVLSREQLLAQVWGYDYAGDTRAVDSAIKRLRARLRAAYARHDLPWDPDLVETVRGIGYRFMRL